MHSCVRTSILGHVCMRVACVCVRAPVCVCAAAGLTNPGDVHYTVRVACYKRVLAAGYWDDPSSVRPRRARRPASFRATAFFGTESRCALKHVGAVRFGDGSEAFAIAYGCAGVDRVHYTQRSGHTPCLRPAASGSRA